MTAEEMWQQYSKTEGLLGAEYDAWSFGDDPDTLAKLVLDGRKTGTSSAFWLYELAGEALPQPGEYSVVLDSAGSAVCVIRNVRVTVLPFAAVGEEQAGQEGEGDRSLAYWRRVHECFFRQALAGTGLEFTESMPVVFEEFRRVWPRTDTENGK